MHYRMLFLLLVPAVSFAQSHVQKLDLLKHLPNEKLEISKVGDGEYEWHLSNGAAQNLVLDFKKLGIDVKQFDEIRFDLKPLVSQVGINAVMLGHPASRKSSGWYLKFKAPTGVWSHGRFDLHLDDDGVWRREAKDSSQDGQFHIRLYRRLLGYPGEPLWRKARVRKFRLVKRLITVDFDILAAEIEQSKGEISYTYPLSIQNRTNKAQTVKLELDSAQTLKFFKTSTPETEFNLKAGETKVLPVKMFIATHKAMSLPPLYSEPLVPKVSIPGIADSDVIPLMGYRRWPMWASVPLFNQKHWTPATFQSEIAAKSKIFPAIDGWKSQLIRRADAALKYEWPVPLDGPPGHDQGYRCRDCSRWLEPKTPVSFNHHFCPKCKKEFIDNEFLNKAWIRRYHSRRSSDMRALAQSWLLTGNQAYAEQAIKILSAYAEAHPNLAIQGARSTSGGSKLGGTTLGTSYVVPSFAETYWFLHESAALDENRRNLIEAALKRMGRNVARHSVEYNNQQAEHFRAYGSVGLATRYWPLTAEAIYGDFGWHEVVEYGFSEDGIAHEGGAYHNSAYQALNHFGLFAMNMGLNLYTPRFKRVFDGSIQAGALPPGSPFYELAYATYGELAYIPELQRVRAHPTEATIFHGVLGLPSVQNLPAKSVHMPGAGYIYLRKGNAADWFGIALNYIKQFDRHERDRFTTFFKRNGGQVDSSVGRITYGSKHSIWMEYTAAHNTIVIDGKNQQAEEGILIKYDGDPDVPMAVVSTHPKAPFYEGVRQVRGIALVENFFVVFDRIYSETPRTIDRYQYGKGKVKQHFKAAPVGELESIPDRGVFTGIKGGNCGNELRVDFAANDLKMRVVSDGDMDAYQAITIGGYQATPMEVTFARRSACKQATFLAAFSLGKETEPPMLRILNSSSTKVKLEIRTEKKTTVLDVDLAQ